MLHTPIYTTSEKVKTMYNVTRMVCTSHGRLKEPEHMNSLNVVNQFIDTNFSTYHTINTLAETKTGIHLCLNK